MVCSIIDRILYSFILSAAITLSPAAAFDGYHFFDSGFALSASPGFHEREFDLTVSLPLMPNATIYWTIDGNEPLPSYDRFIQRNEHTIQVSGAIPADGKIAVTDRTGYWQYSILTAHSDSWHRWHHTLPVEGTDILQGTAFRFRGFVDGRPVTETITATYIIASNAAARFANKPIIAVTAPYEDFIYVYYHARLDDLRTRRRTFNYEYFEWIDDEYIRIFNLPGSSSLGGWGSRGYAQRTINVHLARGQLDGLIEHPIFPGLYELYRFRLWNGGNNFTRDFMRDPFAQTASAGLSVPFSDNRLAIKFINGEFWGFTSIREHTSNRHFVSTRTGIDMDNVALMDRNIIGYSINRYDIVADGDEDVVLALHAELIEFLTSHDMSSDYARQRLFEEFFCQYNFMDYLISNTFFNNYDWPHNNVRFFRAITPDINSPNPYDDGRWRFIFHDMDLAPFIGGWRYAESRFPYLYELHYDVYNSDYMLLNHAFLVFNNPTFAEQFRERALYALDNHFTQIQLLSLHNEFTENYFILLPEMYNRFSYKGSVDEDMSNFITHWLQLREFLTKREYYYRKQLDELVERLSEMMYHSEVQAGG